MKKYFIIILLFYFNCKNKDNIKNCPYHEIEFNTKTIEKKHTIKDDFFIDIKFKFNKLFEKNVNFDSQFKKDFNEISENVEKSELIYNKDLVEKWNFIIKKMCNYYELLNDSNFYENKNKIKNEILSLVDSLPIYYEKLKPENNSVIKQKKINNFDTLSKIDRFEISIQLPNFTNGFSKITIDNKNAEISVKSTRLNPRIYIGIDRNLSKTRKILIYTNNNDSCILERCFSNNYLNNQSIIRYTPDCFKK